MPKFIESEVRMGDESEFGAGELRRLQEIGDLSNDQYKGDPNFMASLARG